MKFLPTKIFCQSNGLFHPEDLSAAFSDFAFQGIAQFSFGIPDGSAGDAFLQSSAVNILAEHSLSSGKQGADQVFGLLGLGFTLRLNTRQHFICGNVVLTNPPEASGGLVSTTLPQMKCCLVLSRSVKPRPSKPKT